ncbi:BgTH12-01680 [Blumeria graminis f. sp. triticale]|uniref:Bgt-1178 n=3 Tax=Blumeria graminis TaxID=34373 RepID=A0A381L2Q7_BLUGR|nr:3-hydroxyacyl-CoA dehydrogenase [Blumeria graminis f. sp. tritici 96224]CAD6501428.1 BgTH12-01680 [Blumeria graminis f. sp. triticale]VDB83923.1 Bgt-1178 [Blumeria graminis f. sp. tritici]
MIIGGRTFVVSGGASGLGRACVEQIYRKGGNVAILDTNEVMGANIAIDIGQERSKFFPTDVTDSESINFALKGVESWVQQTGKAIGGVIAAAGVFNPAKIIDQDLSPLPLEAFDHIMNVNVRGTVDLIRQMVPQMARTTPMGEDGERGIVIMVSSSAAFDGQPGQVAYSASKGAIASLTLPLTRDLARWGIRVTTIAPSLFESGMTAGMNEKVRKSLMKAMEFPMRPGKPHEFATLVVQCIENIMLNGVVIRLDGGMRMPSKM